MNFNEKLENILKNNENFCDTDGELLKQKIKSSALSFDEELIEILLNDKDTKEHFFKQIGEATIFDYRKFIDYIDDKNFLLDSYTKFSNKVGLTISNKHIKQIDDVVLTFPFKDCILEGGQSKEDENRKEIFFNEILAKDEINRLLDKKVISNATKYYYENNEVKETTNFTFTRDTEINKERGLDEDTITDNLIIKGNNLLALHSLKSNFAGKVKLIFIDPPYNTGNDSFNYNDNFNHSTWLTFMKNRFEVARELLSEEGSIYIQLDYNEVHYCKVLLDEVFGIENFQREIIWDISVLSGYKTIANNWVRGHDTILFYSKNNKSLKFSKVRTKHSEKYLARFNKIEENTGRAYFDGRGEKKYLDDVIKKGKAIGDVWNDIISFQQAATSKERIKDFDGQKPENLIERIILSATDENDIVLDYHLGTGTTCSTAHKMGRQYIGIEQMDYIENISVERMKKVIDGEQSGISKAINWKGGGEFIYFELDKYNQKFIDDLSIATENNILEIYKDITEKGFLNYDVELKKVEEHFEEFKAFSLEDKKEFLVSMLNKNMLYKNLTEINDEAFEIDEKTKAINKDFYNLSED